MSNLFVNKVSSDTAAKTRHWSLIKQKLDPLIQQDKELEASVQFINNIIINDEDEIDTTINTISNVSVNDFIEMMNEIDKETKSNDSKKYTYITEEAKGFICAPVS